MLLHFWLCPPLPPACLTSSWYSRICAVIWLGWQVTASRTGRLPLGNAPALAMMLCSTWHVHGRGRGAWGDVGVGVGGGVCMWCSEVWRSRPRLRLHSSMALACCSCCLLRWARGHVGQQAAAVKHTWNCKHAPARSFPIISQGSCERRLVPHLWRDESLDLVQVLG